MLFGVILLGGHLCNHNQLVLRCICRFKIWMDVNESFYLKSFRRIYHIFALLPRFSQNLIETHCLFFAIIIKIVLQCKQHQKWHVCHPDCFHHHGISNSFSKYVLIVVRGWALEQFHFWDMLSQFWKFWIAEGFPRKREMLCTTDLKCGRM